MAVNESSELVPAGRPPSGESGGTTRRAWWRRPGVLVALAAATAVVVAGSVVAGVGVSTAVADPSTGLLRVAHLSPTTPAVDMYVAGEDVAPTKVASGVAYRGLTPYLAEPTGTYTLQARPAGAAPDSPPALSVSVEVPAGAAQTAAFVDIGPGQSPQLQVLDDQTARAGEGTAQLRVVAAAAGLGPLEVRAVGGPPLARDLFYGSATPYVTVPARPWRLELRTRMGATAEVDTPLASGAVGSLVVTREADGELVGEVVPDAASSTPTPGPGSPPSAPTSAPPPGSPPPASPAPRVQPPPRGGIEAGLGGLARTASDDEPTDPPAPRMPVMTALAPPTGLRPQGIEAPSIGLSLPSATDLRVDYRGALQVPTDFSTIGWYTGSAVPGDPGRSVLAGHVDTRRGPAVFGQLDRLRPGDPIDVPRSDGRTARFVVDSVEYYAKDSVPTERIYGPTTRSELRLLTCGGPFDAKRLSYRDNVVVFASSR